MEDKNDDGPRSFVERLQAARERMTAATLSNSDHDLAVAADKLQDLEDHDAKLEARRRARKRRHPDAGDR